MNRIKEISSAAFNIYSWLQNTLNLYDINKKVEPMKKKVLEMTKKLNQLQQDLEATESLLERLNSDLTVLNENKRIKQAQLDELSNQAELMEKRLNAATKLITGLSREQLRWTEDADLLELKKVKLLGDCLTCSSFLSYTGPFDFNYRCKMVYGTWS